MDLLFHRLSGSWHETRSMRSLFARLMQLLGNSNVLLLITTLLEVTFQSLSSPRVASAMRLECRFWHWHVVRDCTGWAGLWAPGPISVVRTRACYITGFWVMGFSGCSGFLGYMGFWGFWGLESCKFAVILLSCACTNSWENKNSKHELQLMINELIIGLPG